LRINLAVGLMQGTKMIVTQRSRASYALAPDQATNNDHQNTTREEEGAERGKRKNGYVPHFNKWRIIFTLFGFLVICVMLPFVWMMVVYLYSRSISSDPCKVAFETSHNNYAMSTPRHAVGGNGVLPKIIHQQWKTEVIPEGAFSEFHAKFKKVFPEPEYTHMLWTNEKARELIKSDFPFFLEAYDNYRYDIQRADAIRYFFLYKFGGLYADMDYEPLIDFWGLLPNDRVALVESPYKYNERTQNSLMSSPARDPFWNTSFILLLERKGYDSVLETAGPVFLDAVQDLTLEPYSVLPCENFQRIPLNEASPYAVRKNRFVMSNIIPMKYCGDFNDNRCHFGRHHNTAVYNSLVSKEYVVVEALIDLLFIIGHLFA